MSFNLGIAAIYSYIALDSATLTNLLEADPHLRKCKSINDHTCDGLKMGHAFIYAEHAFIANRFNGGKTSGQM